MELLMACVLVAIGIGFMLFKAILFGLFVTYPLPGEDLKWKRAPSLPMQELSRRFERGSASGRKSDRNLARGRGSSGSAGHMAGGNKTRPVPPIPPIRPEKLDFPHAERVPLEVMNIDIEDDELDMRPMRHHQYQRDRDPYGTIV